MHPYKYTHKLTVTHTHVLALTNTHSLTVSILVEFESRIVYGFVTRVSR